MATSPCSNSSSVGCCRGSPIKLDLPQIVYADDLVAALSVILVNISEGKISPREGADLAVILNSTARAIDIADLVKRLDMLEAKFNAEVIR